MPEFIYLPLFVSLKREGKYCYDWLGSWLIFDEERESQNSNSLPFLVGTEEAV